FLRIESPSVRISWVVRAARELASASGQGRPRPVTPTVANRAGRERHTAVTPRRRVATPRLSWASVIDLIGMRPHLKFRAPLVPDRAGNHAERWEVPESWQANGPRPFPRSGAVLTAHRA